MYMHVFLYTSIYIYTINPRLQKGLRPDGLEYNGIHLVGLRIPEHESSTQNDGQYVHCSENKE